MRLNTAEALVKYLLAQKVIIDGQKTPFFPAVFSIFGHGNALGLGDALERSKSEIPTLRGQNEQGMALAAVGYAKAALRRQCAVVTTSIGPGATNVVTAAGVAMANRLPLLILSGDTFNSRIPDPVLQQIEHFGVPTVTVNDVFKPVTRYWDRITSPAQLLHSLPQAIATLLDPANCGPVFIGLPQDVQVEVYEFPDHFFVEVVHEIPRPRADINSIRSAAQIISGAKRPLIIAGGGVRYSGAHKELSDFANKYGIPVVETVAGKSSLLASDPAWSGAIGVTGCDPANALAEVADVVIAVGTRLQDFTTGSWTVFQDKNFKLVSFNATRFDAIKHHALAVIGDARESLVEINQALSGYKCDAAWTIEGALAKVKIETEITARMQIKADLPTYAQVVKAVHSAADQYDYVLTAAGGLPGELINNWLSKSLDSFDCEYGYSCMGYEIAGGWGAAMQLKTRNKGGRVFAMVGDGSYMMMNSEIYSAILNGDDLIVVVCDNGGYAVIARLQLGHGSNSFRTMLNESDRPTAPQIDFVAHAASMGCTAVKSDFAGFPAALIAARAGKGVQVIVINTDPTEWTQGGAFWEVGVSGNSSVKAVQESHKELEEGKARQRW